MNKDTMVIIFSGVFLCSVLISSISQILLKKSADRTYDSRLKEYLNPWVIVAYIMFFCSMMITMYCYRYVDVSAGPIFESAGYVFVGILGFIFLKEKFTAKKLLGMVLILLGILVFSWGGEIFGVIYMMFA